MSYVQSHVIESESIAETESDDYDDGDPDFVTCPDIGKEDKPHPLFEPGYLETIRVPQASVTVKSEATQQPKNKERVRK